MRILLIRHGDPDYERDALTERGKVEAALLAERMAKEDVTDFYVSPLGRARETAEYTLKRNGRMASVLDWLQEFPARVDINGSEALQRAYPDTEKEDGRFRKRIAWDMVPSYWQKQPEYFTGDGWKDSEVARCSDLNKVYEMVSAGVDELLAQYGYHREAGWYRTHQGNRDTIALYCHFGATCAVLSICGMFRLSCCGRIWPWRPPLSQRYLQRSGKRALLPSGLPKSGIFPICMQEIRSLLSRPGSAKPLRGRNGTKCI